VEKGEKIFAKANKEGLSEDQLFNFDILIGLANLGDACLRLQINDVRKQRQSNLLGSDIDTDDARFNLLAHLITRY
jgi:hypothetical protein